MNSRLITIFQLITKAREAGFDFGSGNPVNLIHHYGRLGLLPPAVRLRPEGVKGHTVGCYPEEAVGRLLQIQLLRADGLRLEEVKAKLQEPIFVAEKATILITPDAKPRVGLKRLGLSLGAATILAASTLVTVLVAGAGIRTGGFLGPSQEGAVLAAKVASGSAYLEINADTVFNGTVNLHSENNSFTVNTNDDANFLTVVGGVILDQNLSKTSSPTFSSLTLSSSNNQLTLQNNNVVTFPQATGTVVYTNNSQTLTNKSMSGSSNTFTNIPNSALSNSKITISTGSNLSGGGDVSLGGSLTLSLKDNISIASATISGDLGVVGLATISGQLSTGGNFMPLVSGVQNIGSSSLVWNNIYANNVISGSTGTSGFWQRNGGALAPTFITDDVLIGSAATSSAKIVLSGTSGNVGIGSTVPAYKVDIVGTTQITGTGFTGLRLPTGATLNYVLTTDGVGNASWTNPSGLPTFGAWTLSGSTIYANLATYQLLLGSTSVTDDVGRLTVIGGQAGKAAAAINETGDQAIFTASSSGVSKFVINNSGYVGVGLGANTNTTLATVDLRSLLGTQTVASVSGATSMAALVVDNSGAGDIFTASSSGLNRFVITQNGNVGIGTTNPQGILDVAGGTAKAVNITGSTMTFKLGDAAGTNYYYFQDSGANNILRLRSNGEATFFGNVAVSKANPIYQLQDTSGVNYSLKSTGGDFQIINDTRTITPFVIKDLTGNVGIGTTAPIGLLHVRGVVTGKALATFNQNGGDQGPFTASVSGVTKFVINNSGQVGVGTGANNNTLLADVDIRQLTSNSFVASISGSTGKAALTVDNTVGDLFTASSSGLTRFTIRQNGNLGIAGVDYTFPSSQGAANAQLTNDGSGVLSWFNPAGGSGVSGFWQRNTGVLAPTNITDSVIVGRQGTATPSGAITSGSIQLYGVNNLTPVASISAVSAVAALVVDNSVGDLFTASSSGLNRFVITQNGNVGIGTSLPTGSLDVVATGNTIATAPVIEGANDNVSLVLSNTSAGGTKAFIDSTGNGSGYSGGRLILGVGTTYPANSAVVAITSSSVGIGTTVPSGRLNVVSATAIPGAGSFGTLLLSSNNAIAANIGGVLNFGGYYTGTATAEWAAITGFREDAVDGNYGSYMSFYTRTNGLSTAERMRINSSGNVGIGTTAPVGRLDVRAVNGTTSVATISGATSFASLVVDNSGVGDIFTASSSGLNRFVITQNGNVGIGTTTPGNRLYVAASFTPLKVDSAESGSGTTAIFNQTTTPSIQLTSSNSERLLIADTGTVILFRAGNSQPITFNTSGAERVRFDANGNVGIGTTSPVGLLHVEGAVTGKVLATFNQNGGDQAPFTASVSGTTKFVINNSGQVGIGTGANNNTLLADVDIRQLTSNSYVASISGSTGKAALTVDNTVGDLFTASSSGLPRFVITQNGNVGIGTTVPAHRLEMLGTSDFGVAKIIGNGTNAEASIGFRSSNVSDGNFAGNWVMGVNTGSLATGTFFLYNGATAAFPIVVPTSGNVGIGTTLPTALLDVAGTASVSALTIRGTSPGYINQINGNDLQFRTSPGGDALLATKMTLLTSGNLGIGTTAPAAPLNLYGAAITPVRFDNTANSNTDYWSVGMRVPSVGVNRFVIERNGALGSGLDITNTGNVGIGTTVPGFNLHVLGTTDPAEILIDAVGTVASNFVGRRANGSLGSLTAVAANDNLLVLAGTGYNGSAYVVPPGNIKIQGSEAWTTTANGTFISFHTIPNGSTSSTERMRILNSGNVGINTTAPAGILDVRGTQGSAVLSGIIPVASFSGQTSFAAMVVNNDSTVGDIFTASASGLNRFVITNAGNVGIGTTVITQTFQVEGANSNIKLRGNTSSGTWGYLAQSNVSMYINNNAYATGSDSFTADATTVGASSIQMGRGFIALRTAAATLGTPITWTEGMRADSTGNVGVGTTAPRAKLDVVLSSTATSSAFIENSSTVAAITGLTIKLGSNPNNNTSHYVNFLDLNGKLIGSIQGVTGSGTTVAYVTQGINDFGEWMKADGEKPTVGTIVCQGDGGVAPCEASQSAKMVGVVSDTTTFLGGEETSQSVVVGFVGQIRVKTKTSTIHSGDLVAVDPENPGYGVATTGRGYIIGKALSDVDSNGKVLVYVNQGWSEGESYLAGVQKKSIDEIQEQVASLAATLTNSNLAMGSNYIDIASFSAELATISGDLTVLGKTQLGDTSIGGALQIGLLHFDDLKAEISALTGQVTINSNLAVMGDATVSGQLSVQKGIVLKDTATGEDYCVTIKNGEFDRKRGSCE